MEKYQILFHKYILNIKKPDDQIEYNVEFGDILNRNKNICHLHIYDLNFFYNIYDFIESLKENFNIIITYVCGKLETIKDKEFLIIKIKNKGYDIGGKICVFDYLYKNNIDYDYILCLHSKTDINKREQYFKPFKNVNAIFSTLKKEKNIYGIFPDIIWYNYKNKKNDYHYDMYKYNESYFKEILDYLGCKNKMRIFVEGNCIMLHKRVIDYIFKEKCAIFYNILNSENSFDYNWFSHFYKLRDKSSKQIYPSFLLYKNKNLYGNNTFLKNTHLSLADGMIEHVFERIWLNVIMELGGNYLIIEKNSYTKNKYLK